MLFESKPDQNSALHAKIREKTHSIKVRRLLRPLGGEICGKGWGGNGIRREENAI